MHDVICYVICLWSFDMGKRDGVKRQRWQQLHFMTHIAASRAVADTRGGVGGRLGRHFRWGGT